MLRFFFSNSCTSKNQQLSVLSLFDLCVGSDSGEEGEVLALRIFWGAALFFAGIVLGIFVTIFDSLVLGSASFLAHISLWMLINTLLAVHVENAKRAMYWSVPLNLGYVAAYYMATSATFEGYAKSLVVPVSLLAILAPAYVYGVWVAKSEGGIYAFLLSLLCAGGTLAVSYFLNGEASTFAIIVSCIILLFVGIIPTKKLKITPAPHPSLDPADEVAVPVREEQPQAQPRRSASRFSRRDRDALETTEPEPIAEVEERPRSTQPAVENIYEEEMQRNSRPTRRVKTATKRTRTTAPERSDVDVRDSRRVADDEREVRRMPESRDYGRASESRDYGRVPEERSPRRVPDDRSMPPTERRSRPPRDPRDVPPPDELTPVRPRTLGNAQTPVRSRRSSSRN